MGPQAQGYAGPGYSTPIPVLLNTYTGGTAQQRLGNYAEHTQQFESSHTHQDRKHYGTCDNPRLMGNRIQRGDSAHNYENPYNSNANQLGFLQHQMPRLNTLQYSGSFRYPDPNSGAHNQPYFERPIQSTPIDNKTQRNHTGSILPSATSIAPIFKMNEFGYENFPGLEASVLQDLGADQMDLARTAGQFDEQTKPFPDQGTYSQGVAQLELYDLGEDLYQPENDDWQSPQLENGDNKLVRYAPAQFEGEPENYGAPRLNESGYRPRILSEAEYNAKVAERLNGGICGDYPYLDQAAQLEYIRLLFEALRNTDGIIDKPKVAQNFRDGRISDEAIEMVCWQLMLAARASQVHPLVSRFNHDCGYAKCNSFSERMELIINVCREAKSICRMLLAPNYVHRVVDNPSYELKRKKCNITLNTKKTGQNKAGQKAIKANYARENGEWLGDEEVEEVEDEVEERPRKRARR